MNAQQSSEHGVWIAGQGSGPFTNKLFVTGNRCLWVWWVLQVYCALSFQKTPTVCLGCRAGTRERARVCIFPSLLSSRSSGSHGPICRMLTCGLVLAVAAIRMCWGGVSACVCVSFSAAASASACASAFVSVCARACGMRASIESFQNISLALQSPLPLSYSVSGSVSGANLPDAHGNSHHDQLHPPLLRGTAHAF